MVEKGCWEPGGQGCHPVLPAPWTDRCQVRAVASLISQVLTLQPGHQKAPPSQPQPSDLLVGSNGQLGPLLQRPQGRDLAVRDVGGHEVQEALQDHLRAVVHKVLLGGQLGQVILLGVGRSHSHMLWEAIPGHQSPQALHPVAFRPLPLGPCALPDSPGPPVCLVEP